MKYDQFEGRNLEKHGDGLRHHRKAHHQILHLDMRLERSIVQQKELAWERA